MRTLVIAALAMSLLLYSSIVAAEQAAIDSKLKSEIVQKMNGMQIPFIENVGQIDEEVRYYVNTLGGAVYITDKGEIVYILPKTINQIDTQQCKPETVCKLSEISSVECYVSTPPPQMLVLREQLIGDKISVTGDSATEMQVNYFIGNDPEKWKTNIPTYQTVSLMEASSGIVLKLKAYGNNVEKLFIVKPNVNPDSIKLSLMGAKALSVDKDGLLEVETEFGIIKFTKPVAYQEIDGKKVDVKVAYKIQTSEVQNPKSEIRSSKSEAQNPKLETPVSYGFAIASYDKTKELIIDPLFASTFIGGSNAD